MYGGGHCGGSELLPEELLDDGGRVPLEDDGGGSGALPEPLGEADGLPDTEGEPLAETERLSVKLSDRLSELAILSLTLDQDFAEPMLIAYLASGAA